MSDLYKYENKHRLCRAFGIWIDWPTSIEIIEGHNTSGEVVKSRVMTVYWVMTWKPPGFSEKWRWKFLRVPFSKIELPYNDNKDQNKKDELQFLFDNTPIIEIDIS